MKKWEDLTFSDDFMFKLVLRNQALCQKFVERLMRRPVMTIRYLEEEKTIEPRYDGKGIRIDVYVGNDDEVFDLEMQMWNQGLTNQIKRSRYYQSMLDADMIKSGENYTKLKKSYVVFICPFDIFGEGRHIYTFSNICHENHSLSLGDGREIIFFNTVGTLPDIPPELQALADYINGQITSDSRVNELNNEVEKAKEVEANMTAYMNYQLKLEDARYEGEVKGRAETLLDNLRSLMDTLQLSVADAMDALKVPPAERDKLASML